jgi:spoIIIJ-associated protein
MNAIEWVEVRAPSIEEATRVALQELGLDSPDAVDVEILEQPMRGFLGMGAQDAVIRVKPKQGAGRKRRGRRGGAGKAEAKSARSGDGSGSAGGATGKEGAKAPSGGRSGGEGRGGPARPSGARSTSERTKRPQTKREDDDRAEMSPEDQGTEIVRFLTGLLGAFGLEGEVSSRVEDDVIYVEVVGEQTEALVGPKGATLQATLELCRTIIQRRVQAGAKIRLDIAGYNQRRREALKIYARRLGERVLEEGGEVMLEPMNSAERKVVHDTIAEMEGVRSYSEGEEPRRSVVVSKEE